MASEWIWAAKYEVGAFEDDEGDCYGCCCGSVFFHTSSAVASSAGRSIRLGVPTVLALGTIVTSLHK